MKPDWNRLNPSTHEADMEIDIANWVVRARRNKRSPWVYGKARNVLHGLTVAEVLVNEQNKA